MIIPDLSGSSFFRDESCFQKVHRHDMTYLKLSLNALTNGSQEKNDFTWDALRNCIVEKYFMSSPINKSDLLTDFSSLIQDSM